MESEIALPQSPAASATQIETTGKTAVWLRRAVSVAVSAVCLSVMLWLLRNDLPAVWTVVRGISPWLLVLAWMVKVTAFYATSIRWHLILRVCHVRAAVRRLFCYTLIGLFFSAFLPTSVSGDVIKASYVANETDHAAEAYFGTFVDRCIGMIGALLIGCFGVFFFPGLTVSKTLLWVPALLVVGGVVLGALFATDRFAIHIMRWGERIPFASKLRLPRLLVATRNLARAPKDMIASILLTVVSFSVASLSIWIASEGLGYHTSYIAFLLLIPVVTIAGLLPSVNGIGVRETAFVIVLKGLMPAERALALSIIFYGMTMLTSLVGGGVFLLRKPLRLGLASIRA